MSTDTSPYEAARARFDRIAENHAGIVKCAQGVIDWANGEYDAAQANLRQYEESPGIPLPEYREQGFQGASDIGLMDTDPLGILRQVRDGLLALPAESSSEGDEAA